MLRQTEKDQNTVFSLFVSPLMITFFFYIAEVAKTERQNKKLAFAFSRLHGLKFHLLLPSDNSS